MSTGLLIFLIALLLFVIFFQVARAIELVSTIKGEDRSEDTSRTQAYMSLAFMALGFVGIVWSLFHFNERMLGVPASEQGVIIENNFDWALFFTSIVFVITQFVLFLFVFKYREKEGRKVFFIPENNKLEIAWTVVPAIVLTGLVIYGIQSWYHITGPEPEGSIRIEATGKQFSWTLRHSGKDNELGDQSFRRFTLTNELGVDMNDTRAKDDILVSGKLVLPVNEHVHVDIKSMDVLHSFYLPHFRMKMDAVPGTPTRYWFTPTITTDSMRQILKSRGGYWLDKNEEGVPHWQAFQYEIACAELCGTGHRSMRRVIEIVDRATYDQWLDAQENATLGKILTAATDVDHADHTSAEH